MIKLTRYCCKSCESLVVLVFREERFCAGCFAAWEPVAIPEDGLDVSGWEPETMYPY